MQTIQVDDELETANAWMRDQGWSDGLPMIPPTAERVAAMAAGRPLDQVVATIAPRAGEATIARIAANAVMAGCDPAFFPVVLAAASIMGDAAFPLFTINTTTNPVALLCLVNGPIRDALKINYSYGCLGPGWHANATIGRALRLIQLNIGGAIPGVVSKSTHGSPGRYSFCFGEYEEKSPWAPYHVDQGFAAADSTVTLGAVTGTVATSDTGSKTAEDLFFTLAGCMEFAGIQTLRYGEGYSWLILNPDQAEILGVRAGLTKRQVQQTLFDKTSRFPLERLAPWERRYIAEKGRDLGGVAQVFPGPDHIRVVVAGGLGGLHATFCTPFVASDPISRKIDWQN